MKGALSGKARRREPTSKQQTKKRGFNGLRSESSNLSEASVILTAIETSQTRLTRIMSLGTPSRLQPEAAPSPTNSSALVANAQLETSNLQVARVNTSAFTGSGEFLVDPMLTQIELKWESFTSRIVKKGNWARLSCLAKTLITLPDDVTAMFDKSEKAYSTMLSEATKVHYFKQFVRAAAGQNFLSLEEVARAPTHSDTPPTTVNPHNPRHLSLPDPFRAAPAPAPPPSNPIDPRRMRRRRSSLRSSVWGST